MSVEGLPYHQLFAPLILVLGIVYLLGPTLPLARPWARSLIFVAVWLVIARYLEWRLFVTVIPADGEWYEVGWVYFCFGVEALALFDAFVLYVTFLRVSDRRAEADAHEARLRSLPQSELPSVDVYIPTFDEPMEVLEKTITGVLCVDYPNFKPWVLDDGRRPWVKAFCESKGVGYLTRADNAHAKAGNINHALTKTNSDFVAIFDADFIPQRNFLMRTIGFFAEPNVGIVQVPHAFYNYDPTQSSLALQKALPDDQRFFFEAIMPSRDGWDAAFCCGSNSVTRRAALQSVGDALPTESITEDMLLSMALLRNGYVTRYLCERLAVGLAPEGVNAFFVQRRRWARGAMQILYLSAGPLGRNLTVVQRLLFLPTHWLSQSLMLMLVIAAPLVFLWLGVLPLANVTAEAVIYYQLPMMFAVAGGIWAFAPRQYFPFSAQVHGTFQSFKILPTVLMTIAKPFGHVFKVTPKGAGAKKSDYDRTIFWTAATLMGLTILGLVVNAVPEWRIIGQSGLLPIVACWTAINIVVLFLVCMMSLQAPVRRGEERFALNEPVSIFAASGALSTGRIRDISLSGVAIVADENRALTAKAGEHVRLFIAEVGFVAATVVRRAERLLAVQLNLPPSIERDLLIRKLFTAGLDATTVNASAFSSMRAMLMAFGRPEPGRPRAKLQLCQDRHPTDCRRRALSFLPDPRPSAWRIWPPDGPSPLEVDAELSAWPPPLRLGGAAGVTGDAMNSLLFRRGVVERRAFVDDVHGDEFQRLVADDFETAMRCVAQIDRARAGLELDLLAVGRLDGTAFQHIEGFLAVMDVARDHVAGLVFPGRENDLHLGAGEIGALHLLAARRILRLREAGERGGGDKDGEPFGDMHVGSSLGEPADDSRDRGSG